MSAGDVALVVWLAPLVAVPIWCFVALAIEAVKDARDGDWELARVVLGVFAITWFTGGGFIVADLNGAFA